MGNNPSIPVPEQVYRAAKEGRLEDLRELSRKASQLVPGDEGYAQRDQLMEWQDPDGRTALIVAAQKNHVKCVELLLHAGANVQQQSTRKDGGSALHAAVHKECSKDIVDLLLRSGASPFVENSAGFTALDFAVMRKNTGLVRVLEILGLFTGDLKLKTSALMGLKTGWSDRWLAVVPRNPYPGLPASRQIFRRVLLVFQDRQHHEASSSMYLDGAKAEIIPASEGKDTHCMLTLHPTHISPKGNLHVKGGEAGLGHQIFIKSSRVASGPGSLENFCRIVNQPLAPGGGLEQRPSVFGVSHSTLSQSPSLISQSPSMHQQAAPNPYAPQLSVREAHPPAPNAGNYPAIHPWGSPDATPARQPAPIATHPPAAPPMPDDEVAHDDPLTPSAPPLPVHGVNALPATPFDVPEPGVQNAGPLGSANQFASRNSSSMNRVHDGGDDDDMCVVCLSAPKEAGFVHGSSVHKCCCTECARIVVEQCNQCPVCRQEIQHVIEQFYT